MATQSPKSKASSAEDCNPLTMLAKAHAEQQSMCDLLEKIADGLPGRIDERDCTRAAKFLETNLPAHHRQEENGLFAILAQRMMNQPGIRAILNQLREEHATDEGFAEEIAETLNQIAAGSMPDNPDMLGYMLRGFFENYRRHIHWEDMFLFPMAQEHLNQEDLTIIANRLSGQPRKKN